MRQSFFWSLFFLIIFTSRISAQDFQRKAVFMEFCGSSYNSVSINYANTFSQKGKINVGYRMGLGGLFPYRQTFVLPVGVYGFSGKGKSHFLFGADVCYMYGNVPRTVWNTGEIIDFNNTILAVIHLGYRYEHPESRLLYSVNLGYGRAIYDTWNRQIFSAFGFSVGYIISGNQEE